MTDVVTRTDSTEVCGHL